MDLRSANKALKEAGLSVRYYRRKVNEDNDLFTDRIARQLVKILPKLEGEVPLVAHLYDVPPTIIAAIIQDKRYAKHDLRKVHSRAQAESRAKQKEAAAVRTALESAQLEDLQRESAKRVTRERWPTDPEAKSDAIFDFLSVALVQYGSDLVAISDVATKGSIPLWEMVATIKGNPALEDAQQRGLEVAAAEAQSRMLELSRTSNNPSASKMVLTNFTDGLWSDRQEHTHKHVGFTAPAEEESGSVLDSFKKTETSVVHHDGEGTEQ